MRFLILLALLLAPTAAAQPTFANAFGGSDDDLAESVAVDAAGNVYVAGSFERTVDFDPSDPADDADTFTAFGNTPDAFLASYDAAGAFRWAVPMSSTSTDAANAVAVDGDRVFVAGRFDGAALDVDGAGSADPLASSFSGSDGFVAAYTTAGELAWAGALTGPRTDSAFGVYATAGRVLVTGAFAESIDLDPGPGTETQATNINLHAFLASYSAADGAFQWGYGLEGLTVAFGLAVAADGEQVYLVGDFRGTMDFDGGPGVANETADPDTGGGTSDGDGFLAAYGLADGAFRWARVLTGASVERIRSVATNGTQVVVGGDFAGAIDLDPGAGVVSAETAMGDTFDPFVAAYTASGGAYLWSNVIASTMPGSGSELAEAVTLYADRVGVVGQFLGTADFDGGAGVEERTAEAFSDAYIASYALADGALQDVRLISGPSNERAQGLAVNGGDLVVVGGFTTFGGGAVDLDPGPGTAPASSAGGFDAYVVSIPFPGVVAAEDSPVPAAALRVAPNPSRGGARVEVAVTRTGVVTLDVVDALGRRVADLFRGEVAAGAGVDVALPDGLAPGVYGVRARTADGVATTRVTVTR